MLVSLQTRGCLSSRKSAFKFKLACCLLIAGSAEVSLVQIGWTAIQTSHAATVQVTSEDSPASSSSIGQPPRIDQLERPQESFSTSNSVFTAQPLPPTPSAPQTILLPQTPTEDTFTQPDDEAGVAAETIRVPTQNNTIPAGPWRNDFRDTQPPPSASQDPDNVATFAAQDPPIRQFENRGNFNRPQPDEATRFPTADQQNVTPYGQNNLRAEPTNSSFSDQPDTDSTSPPPHQNFGNQPTYQPQRPFNAQPTDSTISDHAVQPTTFEQSLPDTEPQTDLAKQLIQRYLVSGAPNPLPGQPTKLLELLQQPIPINRRQAMVSQYWETWFDWASLLQRAEYVRWLNSVNANHSASDAALLRAAQSMAANQLLAAEIQLGKSQSKLLDFLAVQSTTNNAAIQPLLPLPSDQPLIQKYNTNYDIYQSYQMLPARLRGIDAMLPKTLELICRRATTVQLASSAAENARAALANRQSDLATVLEAGRMWKMAEQDLIASVTSYNQAIADYSLNVTNGSQSPEQIVAMLIAKPKPTSATSSFENRPTFGSPQGGQAGNQAQDQFGTQFNHQSPVGRPTAFGNPPANATSGQFNESGFGNPPPTNPGQPPLQPRSANANFGSPENQFGR